MKILILFIISIMALWITQGCFSPLTQKEFKPSPEMQAKFEEKINKQTEAALDKMIDEKVSQSLPKAVSDGIGRWVLDTGPYGLMGIVALLAGKHWWDLKQERKKIGKS